MSALAELQRHKAQHFFNLRYKMPLGKFEVIARPAPAANGLRSAARADRDGSECHD